jgi:hypothetical protein
VANLALSISTLCVTVISAGGASYAAIITNRAQRDIERRDRDWRQAQADQSRDRDRADIERRRGLDQIRAAYEAEVRSVTLMEQYIWSGLRTKERDESLDTPFNREIQRLNLEHSATHAVVQLLGSAEVVKQADVVGRDLTNAWRSLDEGSLAELSESRSDLIRLMRNDLELSRAPITRAKTLYEKADGTTPYSTGL